MKRSDALSLGASPPDDINVLITTPNGSEPYALRLDERSGAMTVSQLFHTPMRLPGNLGLIPHTVNDAADPLAALVVTSHVLAPGVVIAARPVGVLYVSDGSADDVTVLAVPATRLTSRYARIANYTDLEPGLLREIAHFLSHYRDLEERGAPRTTGWGDINEARRVILEAAARTRRPADLVDR